MPYVVINFWMTYNYFLILCDRAEQLLSVVFELQGLKFPV